MRIRLPRLAVRRRLPSHAMLFQSLFIEVAEDIAIWWNALASVHHDISPLIRSSALNSRRRASFSASNWTVARPMAVIPRMCVPCQ
jgi:hypothetical protein